MLATKRCPTCRETKDHAAFNRNRARHDGLRAHCRECSRAKDGAWRKANREKRLDYERRSRYGITSAEYDAMRQAQDGRCKACGDELQGGRLEHLDHCHTTGRVRGVLCIGCNLALGYVKDDPARLTALIAYLDGH